MRSSLRVALDHREAQLLLDLGQALLGLGQLALEERAHLGVAVAGRDQLARLGRRGRGGAPALREGVRLRELLVAPPELGEPVAVGDDGGIGQLGLDLREGLLDLRDQAFHHGA